MRKLKYVKLFEEMISILNEAESLNEAAKVKIKYTPFEKNAYTTQKTGIGFSVTINNKTATGYWIPRYDNVASGVECEQLKGDRGNFYIFSSGGSTKSYRLNASLPQAAKQPKSLAFTGPYLDISVLKDTFIKKITQAIENPSSNEQLSPDFLNYFGISMA